MTQTPTVITAHINAVNAFDTDAVMATFAPDALMHDNGREFRGTEAIRALVATEIVGAHVTMTVTETAFVSGVYVVRASYDGDFDKKGLPDPLILTNYVVLHDDLISALFIVLNR
jgi:ketosteroid isomerase-like protein